MIDKLYFLWWVWAASIPEKAGLERYLPVIFLRGKNRGIGIEWVGKEYPS